MNFKKDSFTDLAEQASSFNKQIQPAPVPPASSVTTPISQPISQQSLQPNEVVGSDGTVITLNNHRKETDTFSK